MQSDICHHSVNKFCVGNDNGVSNQKKHVTVTIDIFDILEMPGTPIISTMAKNVL